MNKIIKQIKTLPSKDITFLSLFFDTTPQFYYPTTSS